MTPLGKVYLEVIVNEKVINNLPLDEKGRLGDHANVYIWNALDFHLEILRLSFIPKLPKDMKVSGCFAYICRFKNLSERMSIKFNCYLDPTQEIKGFPESGENLLAQSWEAEGIKLSIGTEDEDCLISRALAENRLPRRFGEEELLVGKICEYTENGMSLFLPEFLQNESGQVQFAVAWSDLSNTDPAATWFAVDVSADNLLNDLCL